jgi:hypothetical protein
MILRPAHRRWMGLLLALSLSGVGARAQNPDFLQIGVSSNAYNGDLGGAYAKWTMGVHAGLLLNQKKRLNGSFQLAFGRIVGQDLNFTAPEPGKTASPYFRTGFVTANYEVHYNFIRTARWKCYVAQGFGIIQYTPRDEEGNKLRDQGATRPDGETYGSVSVILPTKIGFIYFLPNGYGLGLESGFLNSMTDYLDNVGQWGGDAGRDNILFFKFNLNLPVNL